MNQVQSSPLRDHFCSSIPHCSTKLYQGDKDARVNELLASREAIHTPVHRPTHWCNAPVERHGGCTAAPKSNDHLKQLLKGSRRFQVLLQQPFLRLAQPSATRQFAGSPFATTSSARWSFRMGCGSSKPIVASSHHDAKSQAHQGNGHLPAGAHQIQACMPVLCRNYMRVDEAKLLLN